MKNKKILLALIALAAVAAIMVGVFLITKPKTEDGEKTITITVVHKDGTEKVFTCKTTEEYLGPVLLQNKIVTDIQDGMFDTVDGEKADFNVDGGWWAVYDADTFVMVGVNELPVKDGGIYKLVYTIGYDDAF